MILLPNFTIPKNLYRDLVSQATYRHQTLAEATRERLTTTLNPNYSFNNRGSEAYHIIWQGTQLQYLDYPKRRKFDYVVSQKTSDIFVQIQQQTGCKDDALVKEIVARLAYTMNDPFYYEFIDREDNLVLSLFLIQFQILSHREYCVSSRVHLQLHRPDFQSHYLS